MSASENIKWRIRKDFKEGKLPMSFKKMYGYRRTEDGGFRIVEEEAEVIRYVAERYLEGLGYEKIACELNEQGIKSPGGNEWHRNSVRGIITNEKYIGDLLLQKTLTIDHVSKKQVQNNGQLNQYYVEGNHVGILSKETYKDIQKERSRRAKEYKGKTSNGVYPFSKMIRCEKCGKNYRRKIANSSTKYRRIVWQCNSKFRNNEKCKTPHLDEERLKGMFVDVFNSMIEDREDIIQTLTDIIKDLTDTTKLAEKSQKEEIKSQRAEEKIREWVNKNAHRAMNQMDYEREYQKRADVYRKIQGSIEVMTNEKLFRQNKYKETVVVLNLLKENEKPTTEFDEGLFHSLIDNVKVMSEKKLVFCFKDRTEIDRDI